MSGKIWTVDGGVVRRRGFPIAVISRQPGRTGWAWWSDQSRLVRYSSKSWEDDDIVEDVKYFHRRDSPSLVMKLESGKKIIFQ